MAMRSFAVGVASVAGGFVGGNLLATVLFASWTYGWVPEYSNPAGVLFAFIQGATSVLITYVIATKFADMNVARRSVLVGRSIISSAVILSISMILLKAKASFGWDGVASLGHILPWVMAASKPDMVEEIFG